MITHAGGEMIAVLALFAGIVAGIVLQPTVLLVLQPYLPIAVVAALDAVFGGIRATLDGLRRQTVRHLSSSPTSWWRRSSCTRRPARRRRPALDRRRGRPRRTDLRQRGGHPPPRVQGVSGMPDDEPRPDQSDRADQEARGPQPVAPVRGRGDHRPAGRSARVRARRAGPQQHRRHPAGERPPGRPGADPVRPQQPRTAPAIGHHRPGADPGPALGRRAGSRGSAGRGPPPGR